VYGKFRIRGRALGRYTTPEDGILDLEYGVCNNRGFLEDDGTAGRWQQ
jgi:hypothetical protein